MPDAWEGSASDIAIVGMALRVPGALDVETFWENLLGGVESIRPLTADELAEAERAGEPIHDSNYVRRTADLPEMEFFDAEFFGLSPKEAAVMDPQHRHFLECAWEALEDAGRMPARQKGPVGVFAASGMGSYFYFNVCSDRDLVEQTGMFLLRHTGNDKDFLSTRISYTFDLHGPSVNVQTACSSSLVAVHQAAQSLLSGECDMALAGGVTIEQPHRRGYSFQEGEILSPDGHCRAFDHRAAGTVFGSGVGVVVLRRLADALADGDIIHAVIKSSAINNDGASKSGYLAPSVTGQAEAVIEAQGLANIAPDTIGYVECHGTGTYLGDPIEIQALTEAFRLGTDRRSFCRVGSVKSNIGHLDTAAGVVSLIKAALAVKHGKIPPTLGFEAPNPSIDFANSPFIVNDQLIDWPEMDRPRRAGVNSLGVGGTNAHVIIQQPPAPRAAERYDDQAPTLLLFSAKNRKALDAAQGRLGLFVRDHDDAALADIAHTLIEGREAFAHRAALAVGDRDDAIAALLNPELKRVAVHAALDNASGAVFLFPGGGAQHHGMVAGLYRKDTEFRRSVDEGIGYLPPAAAAEVRAAWLDANLPDAGLLRPSVQLPAILIIEVALARLWMARGVTPKALVGHSMGENAAACVAGVLSFKDAVNLVRLRGELFERLPRGGMLSAPISEAELRQQLPTDLDIASVNAPGLCVVSGPDEALESFASALQEQGVDAGRIPIDVAAHSRMLEPILAPFGEFLAGIQLSSPKIRILSNVSGQTLSNAEATDPDYWVRHLRSTVRFEQCLAELNADPGLVYIETGPSRALASLAKAQGAIEPNRIINSLPHPDERVDDHLYFLTAIGRAWAAGLSIPTPNLLPTGGRRVDLPTYPFQHRRFFIERQRPAANTAAELLRVEEMTSWGYRPAWRRSVPDIVAGEGVERQVWLIFIDDGDTGYGLAKRLREEGHKVIIVAVGDGFMRRDAENYVICPEHGRAGYDALAAGLAADQMEPDRIAYLPLLTHRADFRPGSSFFNRVQENGFQGLLHLMQALAETNIAPNLHIVAVTNGAQQVATEGLRFPEKATVEGPALVIPREFEGSSVRLVDVELPNGEYSAAREVPVFGRPKASGPTTPPDLMECLLEELHAEPGSEIVAWRGGRRWTRTHARLSLEPVGAAAPPLRAGGVYLITGGLGDLALTFARQLATEKAAKIALLARTAMPAREHWPILRHILPRADRRRIAIEAIETMERAGGEVLVLQGDVTNPVEVKRALEQVRTIWGPISGVLHTAGLVDDAPLLTKTAEAAELVLAPKLVGTLVLAEALADEPVETLILFSSTSSDTAPAGQVDYVAANAFLNAFAESQSSRADRRTVAVHWGIWNQIGMAARSIAETEVGDREIAVANGPFFQRWIEDGQGVVWLEAHASASRNWLFNEHRLVTGEALMPGTGYVELIYQAMREAELPDLAIRDLEFRSPMFAPEGEVISVRLRFAFVEGSYEIAIASLRDETLSVHAVARLVPNAENRAAFDVEAIERRCALRVFEAEPGKTLTSAQERHLRFGPRWRVLRRQRTGNNEAIARLSLSQSFCSDIDAGYRAHPGLLDIATGFAMDIIPDYASDALWVPASYGRIAQWHSLPASIVSWVRLADNAVFEDGFACFDIALADPSGMVLLVVEKLLLKRLDATLVSLPAPLPKRARLHSSPGSKQLTKQVQQGILPVEALDALQRALASGITQPIVSSVDLPALIRNAEQSASGRKAKPGLTQTVEQDHAYLAPSTPVERRLAEHWQELMGVEQIGVDDNFFDIGGHSLLAVRLFRAIRKEFGVDLPISTLFEAPTIALLARLLPAIETDSSPPPTAMVTVSQDLVHRVAMHVPSDSNATPLFICAGMFGNILNLRQLARQVGSQRVVYGLQAQGIYGDTPPHETFEEAAASCISEMRQVQPEGPYLLAGFSGGGLVAYEIALQLQAAGEEVSQLIMLDTPLPTQPGLSKRDLVSIKLQELRRDGSGFLMRWLSSRLAWQEELRRKQEAQQALGAADRFNNELVEAAFRRSLVRYQVRPYTGAVTLFRPRPEIEFNLSNGRKLMPGRTFFFEDNGWSPYVERLQVVVVPGDHDNMVLDPNVRVLSDHMRRILRDADVKRTTHRAAE